MSFRAACQSFGTVAAIFLWLAATACSSSNPATPTGTGSVTTPRIVSPANNATIRNVDQPITLVFQNAVATASGATYTVEVSSDSAFSAKIQTKTGVAEGSGGQTRVKLDALAPGHDYYWHTSASAGGTTGVFGATSKFTVGPAVTITAPVLIAPINGAATAARPTLRVANAARTGPAGPITYQFEVATSAAFNPALASGTVAEGVNETGFAPPSDLPANTTLFWRVTAADAVNGVSATSTAQNFVTSLAIDLSKVVISYPDAPSEIASWKQTGTIIAVEQDGAGAGPMCISFTTTDDWPSVPFFGDPTVPVYANQWYFANIGGTWYAGPGEYLRSDRSVTCKSGQGTYSIGPDGGWNTVMRSWVPKVGEMVGYMVSTPARNYRAHRTIDERTNVVVQPWRDTSLGSTAVGRTK